MIIKESVSALSYFDEKDVNNLVLISKAESIELNKMGVRYGENGISHTYTSNKHYYLCESKYNMDKLKTLRESKKIK